MIQVINYGSGKYESLALTQDTGGYPRTTHVSKPTGTRGDNWWRWKPELLLSAMTKHPDEFILYIDAGDLHLPEFWQWLPAYATVNDTLFCTRGYIHQQWTKGDCFEAMGMLYLMNEVTPQLEAGLIGLRANDDNIALVEDWADWMADDQILTDTPSKYPNHPEFIEHRHDQSILTNLIIRDKIPYHHVNHVIWNARQF